MNEIFELTMFVIGLIVTIIGISFIVPLIICLIIEIIRLLCKKIRPTITKGEK